LAIFIYSENVIFQYSKFNWVLFQGRIFCKR